MRNRMLLAGALMLLIVTAPALAADVAGTWVAESEGMQGAMKTTFTFKVDGSTLTGTVSGRGGDSGISEGKINGDEISFVVVRSLGENEIKTLYKGKVSGNEIRFTRETQGAPGGGMGRGGGMGAPGGGMGAPGGGMGAPGGGMGAPGGGMGAPGGGMGAPGGGMGAPGGGMGAPREIIAKRVE
jgi:hypothetical protein